ncbi:MAG: hypothetical protein LBS19_09725, partial [Clostridiales bacterium]|nr:hypothetical protein [Clostridiales bacterium]
PHLVYKETKDMVAYADVLQFSTSFLRRHVRCQEVSNSFSLGIGKPVIVSAAAREYPLPLQEEISIHNTSGNGVNAFGYLNFKLYRPRAFIFGIISKFSVHDFSPCI